ncbi:hypothetical protein PsorP6_008982 [Peronosclerospora sorghi]|uniref:Uncharacterized protein n=1 Tax=Peronosclerospora sorghi TaxID=230839 RepID=A0ACC0W1A1_9STRA|nr:hypothetical protein PsorP6_008982 [Peronosclerospora sorghi]
MTRTTMQQQTIQQAFSVQSTKKYAEYSPQKLKINKSIYRSLYRRTHAADRLDEDPRFQGYGGDVQPVSQRSFY